MSVVVVPRHEPQRPRSSGAAAVRHPAPQLVHQDGNATTLPAGEQHHVNSSWGGVLSAETLQWCKYSLRAARQLAGPSSNAAAQPVRQHHWCHVHLVSGSYHKHYRHAAREASQDWGPCCSSGMCLAPYPALKRPSQTALALSLLACVPPAASQVTSMCIWQVKLRASNPQASAQTPPQPISTHVQLTVDSHPPDSHPGGRVCIHHLPNPPGGGLHGLGRRLTPRSLAEQRDEAHHVVRQRRGHCVQQLTRVAPALQNNNNR